MSTVEKSVEQIPDWKLEGLPGIPVFTTHPNKMHNAPLDKLIRDDRGKIVTAPRHDKIEQIISEHLGKTIDAVKLFPGKGWAYTGEFMDIVAFHYAGNGRLSLLERRAIAAFAWMADKYYPPMKRRKKTVFPTALADLPTELQSPRLNSQMWKIFTEDKAIQVASVLESMFPDIDTTVFEDGDGWFVAIDSGEVEIEDVSTMERIETILWLLSDFDAVPNENSMETIYRSADEEKDVEEYFNRKALRAFNAYHSQQRIEDGINAILAHLGHPAAGKVSEAAPDAPQATENPPKRRGIDSLIPPVGKPAGKKPSAKQTA